MQLNQLSISITAMTLHSISKRSGLTLQWGYSVYALKSVLLCSHNRVTITYKLHKTSEASNLFWQRDKLVVTDQKNLQQFQASNEWRDHRQLITTAAPFTYSKLVS